MQRHRFLVAFCAVLGATACQFEAGVPADVRIVCGATTDCPADMNCVDGRCRPPSITAVPKLTLQQGVVVAEDAETSIGFLLTNVEADDAVFQLIQGPAHGVLVCDEGVEVCRGGCAPLHSCVVARQVLWYRPAPNFNGLDDFTIRVARRDATDLTSDDLKVNITVEPRNDAPDVTGLQGVYAVSQGSHIDIAFGASDVDGDALTLGVAAAPGLGQLDLAVGETRAVVDGQATVSFSAPAETGAIGSTSFTLLVDDGQQPTQVEVHVNVTDVNAPPVCDTDCPIVVTLTEDVPASVEIADHVHDPESDAFWCYLAAAASLGQATIDGTILLYAPGANVNGAEVLELHCTDGQGASQATLQVTITPVNDPPLCSDCADLQLAVEEDTPGSLELADHAQDPEGDAFWCYLLDTSTQGEAVIVGTSLQFTPAPGASGSEVLRFRCSDGAAESEGSVKVSVAPVNDPPLCTTCPDLQLTVAEDEAAVLDLADHVQDPEADAFWCYLPQAAALGEASIDGTSLRVVAAPDVNGTESLVFRCTDGTAESGGSVAVTITPVNDPPGCAGCPDLGLTIEEDGTLDAVDLSGFITDLEQDAISCAVLTDGALGSASFDGTALTYATAANENGADRIRVRCVDDGTPAASSDLSIDVAIAAAEDIPIALPVEAQVVDEDASVIVALSAFDPDGDAVDFELFDAVAQAWRPASASTLHGTLHTVLALPQANLAVIRYLPDPDYFGADVVRFRASKPGASALLSSDPVDVAVTVEPVPDPPLIGLTGPVDLPAGETAVDIPLHITDPDGDSGSYTITADQPLAADPLGGGAYLDVGTVVSSNGDPIWFQRDALFVDASFHVHVVDDNDGLSADATVTVRALGYPSCAYIRTSGSPGSTASGVHLIDPGFPNAPAAGHDPRYFAHCDMVSAGGGWTLVLRVTGSKDPGSTELATFEFASPRWFDRQPINPRPGLESTEARLASWSTVPFRELLVGVSPVNNPRALRMLSARLPDPTDSYPSLYDAFSAPSPAATHIPLDTDRDPGESQGDPWRRLFWAASGTENHYEATSPYPPFKPIDCPAELRPGPADGSGNLVPRIGLAGRTPAIAYGPDDCSEGDAFIGIGGVLDAAHVVYTGAVDVIIPYQQGAFAAVWVRDNDFTRLPPLESCAAHRDVGRATLNGFYRTAGGVEECTAISTDPPQICQNGLLEGGEECDDGNATNGDPCANNCTFRGCGNGVVEETIGEQCDPPAEGVCTEACQIIGGSPQAACGNGIREGTEQCDDGNTDNSDGCNIICTLPWCGNGVLEINNHEECDDGNANNADNCHNDCIRARCGNGRVETYRGEQCDDGNQNNFDSCYNSCVPALCGNGVVEPWLGEECEPPDGYCCELGSCLYAGGGG